MKSDRDLLKELLASDKLQPDERGAFGDMLRKLANVDHLTIKQREELELDAEDGAKNLWSSGQVPQGIVDKSHGEVRQLEKRTVTIRGRVFNLTTGQPVKPPGR